LHWDNLPSFFPAEKGIKRTSSFLERKEAKELNIISLLFCEKSQISSHFYSQRKVKFLCFLSFLKKGSQDCTRYAWINESRSPSITA